MKATKRAERRVDPRRIRVAIAQAQARMDTMKRTRIKDGVNWLLLLKPLTNHAYALSASPERPIDQGRGRAYQHANHWDQRDDLHDSPEGEKQTSEHLDQRPWSDRTDLFNSVSRLSTLEGAAQASVLVVTAQ